jgi:transposase-like protein
MDRSTAAAKEIRECIEGKIHENVDLTVNVEEDIVLRLKRAHKRMQRLKAQREAQLTNGSHTIDVAVITSGT